MGTTTKPPFIVWFLQWLFGIQNVGFALWLYGTHWNYVVEAHLPTWAWPILGLFFIAVLGILIAQKITWKQLPQTTSRMLVILLLPYVIFLIEAAFTPLLINEFIDNAAFVVTLTNIGAMTLVIWVNATRGLIKLRQWWPAGAMVLFTLLYVAPALLAAFVILNGRVTEGSLTEFGAYELIAIVLLSVIVEYRTFLKEFSLAKN